MRGDHKEFELKFELADEELRRLRSKRLLREIGVDRPVTRVVRSIYFDTPDSALRAAGLSLRLRRDRKAWLQTVKDCPDGPAGVSDRLESESRLQSQVPDLTAIKPKSLRKRIKKTIGTAALEPVFETVVWRTTRRLRTAEGCEIELALDKGEVRSAELAETFHEAELELKSGSQQSVFAVARELFADEPPQLSHLTKADRGYRLNGALPAPAVEPQTARAPVLTPDLTAAQAFRKILRACRDQILHNVRVVLETEHPGGPHQLRIGLRRLRCALRAYRPIGDKQQFRRLSSEARDLARTVGELRDADVVIDEFIAPHAEQHPAEPGIAALLKTVRAHRERVRKAVRRQLASARAKAFQFDLCAMLEADPPYGTPDSAKADMADTPVCDYVPGVLQAHWRKPAKLGKRLDQLSIAERHQMRKALKNLRYVVEFHASLYPGKAVRRYVGHLKKLQSVFGYLNDVAMTKKLREICSGRGAADVDMHWAIGHLQGLNEARAEYAWETARARWRTLNTVPAFWA